MSEKHIESKFQLERPENGPEFIICFAAGDESFLESEYFFPCGTTEQTLAQIVAESVVLTFDTSTGG